MAKLFTAAGSYDYAVKANQQGVVAVQGNAEDFTWSAKFSLDDGTTWSVYKDAAGESVFTGSDTKEIRAVSDKVRLTVVDMGTATEVRSELVMCR